MTVLFIVLLHAVPVFIIGAWTESKTALSIAAVIAGIIGAVSGSSMYTFADLLGIFVAYLLCIGYINSQKQNLIVIDEASISTSLEQKKRDVRENRFL
jgi:hypothetical protein